MKNEDDRAYFKRRARQHLGLAEVAATPEVKVVHLNYASQYATLAERASRKPIPDTRTRPAGAAK